MGGVLSTQCCICEKFKKEEKEKILDDINKVIIRTSDLETLDKKRKYISFLENEGKYDGSYKEYIMNNNEINNLHININTYYQSLISKRKISDDGLGLSKNLTIPVHKCNLTKSSEVTVTKNAELSTKHQNKKGLEIYEQYVLDKKNGSYNLFPSNSMVDTRENDYIVKYLERFERRVISKKFSINDDGNKEPLIYEIALKQSQQDLILNSLKYIKVLDVDDSFDDFSVVCKNFLYVELDSKSNICKINEEVKLIYIVESGTLLVRDVEQHNNLYKKGEILKKGDVLHSNSRLYNVTVESIEKTNLLCINKDEFDKLIDQSNSNSKKKMEIFIDSLPYFKDIKQKELDSLIKHIKIIYLKNGQHMDLTDEYLYVIKSGNLILSSEGQLKTYSYGDCINLVSCLFELKLKIYFELNEHVSLISISRKDLIKSLGITFDERMIKSYFTHSLYNNTDISTHLFKFENHFNLFNLKQYSPGSIVFSNLKSINQKLVFIIFGSLENQTTNQILATEGDIYGFSLLNLNENLDYKIVSSGKLVCLEAKWSNLVKSFPTSSKKSLNLFNRVRRLKKNYLFNMIDEYKLTLISSSLKKITFESNNILWLEKEKGDDCLYFILSGKIRLFKNKELVRILDEDSLFGETVLLQDRSSQEELESNSSLLQSAECINMYTVKTMTKVECYQIHKNVISSILDPIQLDHIIMRISLLNCDVKLEDLWIFKTLGKGKFGEVYLVNNSKFNYAIKAINKSNVDNPKLKKYLHKEKKIMMKFDHPFIVKLAKTFQTSKHVFFLMENIEGIALSDFLHLRPMTYLHNYKITSFYAAILILVIEYMNKNGYAHRDLKPDNIILAKNGYLKLIDFGISKKLKLYTRSIVGTPHYIAPEIVTGEEYTFSIDYWSLGICLYEIFYGYYPFGNLANNPHEIFSEIANSTLSLPYEPRFKLINSFLKKLICKNKVKRANNFITIKNNSIFEDFNFELLLEMAFTPPYKPSNPTSYNSFKNKSLMSHLYGEIVDKKLFSENYWEDF